MRDYRTLREAFVAEALGDIDRLANRLESLHRGFGFRLVAACAVSAVVGGIAGAVLVLRSVGV